MDEPFLLGLSISIWANIGVSIGTLVLAYFTYTAVKASREQIELSRKSIEKPRVVENIQNTLNTLQQELDLELNAIYKNNLMWVFPNEQTNFYISPLVFPLTQLKFFYDNFRGIFQGPDIKRSPEIASLIPVIAMNLKKRHEIYQNIDQNLKILVKEIENSHYEKRREDLIMNSHRFRILYETNDNGKLEPFFHDVIDKNRFTEDVVDNILKSMIISTIFKPLQKGEIRFGCLPIQTLVQELYDKIPEFLVKDPIPQSDEIKASILGLLSSLKTAL